jgi:Holliday junction resolvasome RuvABC endonuclease subunit
VVNENASDPTALTTEALLREISHLEKQIDIRLTAMDRAVEVFKSDLVRVPTELDRRLIQIKELVFERFSAIDVQFNSIDKSFIERDVRNLQSIESSKTAISTALTAQKALASDHIIALSAAINKSEQHTTNQLEQQRTVLISVEKTLSDKINDVSDRMNRWEGVGSGKGQISAPLWAMAASVLMALMIAGLMMLFQKPKDPSNLSTLNSSSITEINRRLDSIEQTLQRGLQK